MPKRLEVLLGEDEYKECQRIARSQGLTLSEWVRQSLKLAMRDDMVVDAKLRAIEEASRRSFPSGDIEDMLREIEAGRR